MTTLQSYFSGIAAKYLSAVDATSKSNQHEIGSNKFVSILGDPGAEKKYFEATFLFFDPDKEEPETCLDKVTWYDTRIGQPHRASEFRLYYRNNAVTEQFQEGDFCLIGRRTDGTLLIATARPDSAEERRIRLLFGLEKTQLSWIVEEDIGNQELNYASRQIIEALGIEPAFPDTRIDFDALFLPFSKRFPTTKVFSDLARKSLPQEVSPLDDPDGTLEAWMNHEEILFKAFERTIVQEKLTDGFSEVDDFIRFSLSVQNRRKSRVGHALEHHLAAIFDANRIMYERGALTENKSKPDFLFPGSVAYHDLSMTSPPLYMLGAKTTCKDRWRQVLTEAARIPNKHLFTLETAISANQLQEMRAHSLQLVSTPGVLATYPATPTVQSMTLAEFIHLVRQPR